MLLCFSFDPQPVAASSAKQLSAAAMVVFGVMLIFSPAARHAAGGTLSERDVRWKARQNDSSAAARAAMSASSDWSVSQASCSASS